MIGTITQSKTTGGMKFSSVEEAVDYINSQLALKGFLKQDSSLSLNSTVDDQKLVINTINKLLNSLDDKNAQIAELHASRQSHLKPLPVATDHETVPQPVLPSRPPRVAKPAKITHKANDNLLSKRYKVKLNKLQSTIEALRQQIQLERNRKHNQIGHGHGDMTWRIHEDLTTLPQHEHGAEIENYKEELATLLEAQNKRKELDEQLMQFLATVNRYTYSAAIMGIRDLDVPAASPQVHQLLSADFQELITDWYEIVAIARNSEH